jgi:toxin YhaV
MEIHGWRVFVHPLFEKQLEKLTRQVERLESRDPKGYAAHPATRILSTINYYIREAIPLNLTEPVPRRWIETRFHGRYRLFYRASSRHRIIIYVWISNDHDSRTGAFGMFRTILERGELSTVKR